MNFRSACLSSRHSDGPPSPTSRSGEDVEQPAAAVTHARDHFVALVRQQRAVQERRRDAVDAEPVDLILHQRDERRDDQAQALGRDRGRLKAERLAAAGRQDDDAVARGEDSRASLRAGGGGIRRNPTRG